MTPMDKLGRILVAAATVILLAATAVVGASRMADTATGPTEEPPPAPSGQQRLRHLAASITSTPGDSAFGE